jgi:hypothetical protein
VQQGQRHRLAQGHADQLVGDRRRDVLRRSVSHREQAGEARRGLDGIVVRRLRAIGTGLSKPYAPT